MAIGQIIAQARQARGLTQLDLANRLMVTRQAVSRWETGAVTPGIDMCKLLAVSLEVPVARLLEMPPEPWCQSCAMPLSQEEHHGTQADGTISEEYCSWCYEDGEFVTAETMEELIERSAPFMAESCHISNDEAISYMAAVLPALKRWEQAQTPADQG